MKAIVPFVSSSLFQSHSHSSLPLFIFSQYPNRVSDCEEELKEMSKKERQTELLIFHQDKVSLIFFSSLL